MLAESFWDTHQENTKTKQRDEGLRRRERNLIAYEKTNYLKVWRENRRPNETR